jgi:hypothetical protein
MASPPPRLRLDVPLSNAHRLAFIHDHDGEIVVRVLCWTGERWEYQTPKVRLTEGDLVDLVSEDFLGRTLDYPPIVARISEATVEVYVGVALAGWIGRETVVAAVQEFLERI